MDVLLGGGLRDDALQPVKILVKDLWPGKKKVELAKCKAKGGLAIIQFPPQSFGRGRTIYTQSYRVYTPEYLLSL